MKKYCYSVIIALLVVAAVVGGIALYWHLRPSGESATKSRLASLLETNGFTVYSPFRTDDYPGSLFILSKNSMGRVTEFSVSKYDQTFDVATADLFDPKGSAVSFGDKLSEKFTFSGKGAVDLMSVALDASFEGDVIEEMTMTFGDPKTVHTIPFGTLAKYKSRLANPIKDSLRDFKSRNQLDNVFLVMETVTVSSMDIEITVKSDATGKVSVEKLKHAAKAGVEVKAGSDGKFSLSSKTPLIIGYKAVLFPESILRNEVSSPDLDNLKLFDASVLAKLKEK